jgi:anti-sigma28 factor (negative regulator of flagellin synthesis)
MSLRIQSDVTSAATSLDVGRTSDSVSTAAGSSQRRVGTGSGAGDQIDISSAAESIAAKVSNNNLEQAGRIKQLTALYSGGQYSLDSAKISRAIVDSAVSAAPASEV